MAANGQYDSSHYQHSTKCLKTYLYFTVKLRANQALHTLDLKVIPPLFSTELNINMGLIKLIAELHARAKRVRGRSPIAK